MLSEHLGCSRIMWFKLSRPSMTLMLIEEDVIDKSAEPLSLIKCL